MAQLPLVRERSVQSSGQAPGYQQVQYSPDAFGAGIGRALQQTGDTLTKVAAVEAKLRDQVKANDALGMATKADDELRQVMYDPKDGMLAQNGGNAMGVGQMTSAHTEALRKKYLEQIKDPETKTAFERIWSRSADQAKNQAASHELSQLGTYKLQTTKAVLAGGIQDAYNGYNDDKAVSKAIEDSKIAIRANSIGLDPKSVALAEEEAESSIHLAALSRWASEDPYKALEYYEKNKDNLSGKDHVTANGFVQTALQERRADEHVARIAGTTKYANDLAVAVEGAESSFLPGQISPKGALGPMQIMPDTARMVARQLGMTTVANLNDAALKKVLLFDEDLNRKLGTKYLQDQLDAFGQDIEVALVAYNAGPEAAKAFVKHNVGRSPGQRDYDVPGWKGIKTDSEPYVKKVMGAAGVGVPASGRMTRDNWSLRNFQPDDLMAPTEGGQWVDARAATQLDELATRMQQQFPGFQIKINEDHDFQPGTGTAGKRRGTSDPKDNPHVENSQHLHGTAFDIQIQGWNDVQKAAFLSQARQLGFGGIGFYGPNGHLHIDMGTPRKWGKVPAWAKSAMKVPVTQAPGAPSGRPSSFGGMAGTGAAPGTPGSYFAQPQIPDMARWAEAANAIIDSGERERTMSKLRIIDAQWDAAAKQQKTQIENTAWQTVIAGGTADLDPALLARLEPSFVNSLYAYEGNRASGKMPMDWEAWATVPTDPATLAAINPMDYRNKLDDSHFDQLMTLHRAAQNALRGDESSKALLANTRTRNEIVADSATLAGEGDNKEFIAGLERALEPRLLAEQAAKGKPLTSEEIQDIVDKLLIEDKAPGLFDVSEGYAFQAEDPAEVTAAETWDEVQPDDQEQLVNVYRRIWQRDPNQDEAVDVFNRAMRVYLGAEPEIPEDELPALTEALRQKYGTEPSQRDINDAYRTYLLRFLGR